MDRSSGSFRPFRGMVAGATLLGLLAAGGCVRRVVEITSEPSGAIVWMNDREVGSTPCEVEILHYGTYDLRLTKAGYEPFTAGRKATPPAWDLPGPDLVAEILPIRMESRNAWHVSLVVEDMSTDAVLERAIVTRDRLAALIQATPPDSQASESQNLARKVQKADGMVVEPGEPVEGEIAPIVPVPVDRPGLGPFLDPAPDPALPAERSSED